MLNYMLVRFDPDSVGEKGIPTMYRAMLQDLKDPFARLQGGLSMELVWPEAAQTLKYTRSLEEVNPRVLGVGPYAPGPEHGNGINGALQHGNSKEAAEGVSQADIERQEYEDSFQDLGRDVFSCPWTDH